MRRVCVCVHTYIHSPEAEREKVWARCRCMAQGPCWHDRAWRDNCLTQDGFHNADPRALGGAQVGVNSPLAYQTQDARHADTVPSGKLLYGHTGILHKRKRAPRQCRAAHVRNTHVRSTNRTNLGPGQLGNGLPPPVHAPLAILVKAFQHCGKRDAEELGQVACCSLTHESAD